MPDNAPNDRIEIVSYDPAWPHLFRDRALAMRNALGCVAIRIDHIGSTAVPGLAAKPIIDIQISVESLNRLEEFRSPLLELGYVFRHDNPELTKRYFREPPGAGRQHIHVRAHGSFTEQFALLFRDYMRTHADEASAYAELKMRLAREYRNERHAYTEAKEPFIWNVVRRASDWSQRIGWSPGPTDV